MRGLVILVVGGLVSAAAAFGQGGEERLPLAVGSFSQHVHTPYRSASGLEDAAALGVELDVSAIALTAAQDRRLRAVAGESAAIRGVAAHDGEFAVAADTGLYIGDGRDWRLVLPQEGSERWAPVDVRAVCYDASGALWFAAPQGVGYRVSEGEWKLYTGAEGLPFNDFTCMAAGPRGVWFGTTNGAIRYFDGDFAFRQGGRWLVDSHVTAIAVDAEGSAWIATQGGVSRISERTVTLAEKAAFFEKELDTYNRRTEWGFAAPAILSTPGDKSTAKTIYTDNDGHFTGLYLGAVSLAYAVTGDPKHKADAQRAFRALAFLSEVTSGGTHPAPKGFVARTVLPTTEPDPNPDFDLAYDLRRRERDKMWKIIQPRWPIDETGKWYWKNDSSHDELDGHFFGYGIYFDHVCETEAEREEVRAVVRRIVDHLIVHGYRQVDYDGKPTRWGNYAPDDMNRNPAWVVERGLKSYAMLTYLIMAHHMTGEAKYREAYLELALDHGYGMNGMTQPKDITGPGSFGQPDDNHAFMNYYHLIRYETDPTLLSMYYRAINHHWQVEKYERNPYFNFIYAACCYGKIRSDQWGDHDLTPPQPWLEESVDTLKRYPLDLVLWPMSNAHRTDMVPLGDHLGQRQNTGHRVGGGVFPVDESNALYWGDDPYFLVSNHDGTRLREGVPYLLGYYMGRYHGFIAE